MMVHFLLSVPEHAVVSYQQVSKDFGLTVNIPAYGESSDLFQMLIITTVNNISSEKQRI